MHETSSDGSGLANEPIEADRVDVYEPRPAILDSGRNGQSRLEESMTSRRDVFLDPWSRQQHRAAGTRFSLRHARTHALLAGRGVRFEGRHDLGGGAVSMASRHAFPSGVLVAHPSPEDRQPALAERGLASLDGRRIE